MTRNAKARLSSAVLSLALAVALAGPAPGQNDDADDGVSGLAGELEEMFCQLDACDAELRSTIVLRVRAWGDRGRAALRAMDAPDEESGRTLRRALLEAPPFAADDDGDLLEPKDLEAALEEPIPGDPLEEARRYRRFTEGLERARVAESMARLRLGAPDHPWLHAVDTTLSRAASVAPIVSWIDALSDVLGDPATIAECERWLLEPADVHDHLGVANPGHRAGSLVRAAWMLRQGRPLLAGRLARAAELHRGLDSADEVVPGALDTLAAIAWQAGIKALGEGASRTEVAANLSRVVDMTAEAAGRIRNQYHREELLRSHAAARSLREHLLAQAEADRRRPPPPPWEEWQRTSPDARLPILLAHLRDQAGRQVMEPGGADPLHGSGCFPPDSPAKRSVAHELMALGDLAVPALIELLVDERPTRTVQFHRSWAAHGWEVLPLARVAERALEAMWGEDILHASAEDWRSQQHEKQEQARAWLTRWTTLADWHVQRAQEAELDWVRARHVMKLLRLAPTRARALAPRVYQTLENGHSRSELLRAIGEAADPEYLPLLHAELGAEDLSLVVEAALGLIRLEDSKGKTTLCELVRRSPGALSCDVIERVSQAGAPVEAGRILLEVTDRAAWSDWHTSMIDPEWLPRPDVVLALARIVARREDGEMRDIALETLARLGAATGSSDARLLTALLTVDAEVSAHAARRRHGAATVLALGVDAVARFEASTGPRVRRELLAGLDGDDTVARAAFVEALSRAGPNAFDWAVADVPTAAPERGLLARARVDASLWVHGDVAWPSSVSTSVPLWLHRRWEPGLLADLVTEWEAAERTEALVVTVERAANLRGVSVHSELSATTHDPGLHLYVRAPGLTFDGRIQRDQLPTLLGELSRALEHAPDEPATIRLVAPRRAGHEAPRTPR